MNENLFRKIQRNIRANLSFLFNKYETDSSEIKVLTNEVFNKSKFILRKKISKKKTHKIFSNSVSEMIKEKKLINFMRNGFIQQMFFIHNRMYLFSYLIELKNSNKWKFWKKLLKENSVGSPIKYFLYPSSSGNKIFQTYHLKSYEDFLKSDIKNLNKIIEFGGGYGNMAETFKKINKDVDYTIFDTPEVSLLQYYYLSRLKIKTNFNSCKKKELVNLIYSINILKLKSNLIKSNSKKLFIANWSLSETPLDLRKEFKFITNNFDYQLISFQKNFEGIDNFKFFKKVNEYNLNKNRISKIIPIKKMKDHFYLFSKKNLNS